VLAIARSVDVDADGVHGETVEDSGGDSCVAEVAPPFAKIDIGRDRCRELAVPAVDEVEKGVCGGGLVVALPYLAEADIVDDQELGARPSFESSGIGIVGEAGVQVGE
jgi:hypothetical protein